MFKPELPHNSTHSQPFSFEHRDKELKQKKEEKIKTVLEEEKKVSQFSMELDHSHDCTEDKGKAMKAYCPTGRYSFVQCGPAGNMNPVPTK